MKIHLKNNMQCDTVTTAIIGSLCCLIAIIICTWLYFTSYPTFSLYLSGQVQTKQEMMPAMIGMVSSLGSAFPGCLAAYGGMRCFYKSFLSTSPGTASMTKPTRRTRPYFGVSQSVRRKKILEKPQYFPAKIVFK